MIHDTYLFKPDATVLEQSFDATAVFRSCLLAKCVTHIKCCHKTRQTVCFHSNLQTCARASCSWDEIEKSEQNIIDSNKIAIYLDTQLFT